MDPMAFSGGNINESPIFASNDKNSISISTNEHSIRNIHNDEAATSSKKANYDMRRRHQQKTLKQNVDRNMDVWLDDCLRDSNQIDRSVEYLERCQPNKMSHSANAYRQFALSMKPSMGMNENKLFPPSIHGNQYLNNINNINNNAGFTSLPPAVNLMTGPEYNYDSQELLNTLDNRRYGFSDPCLAANSDSESKESNFNHPSEKQLPKSDSSNLLTNLLQQINILHDTNAKICKNLEDTKVDIETMKYAPNWSLRHRRDSISGLSTHSQPLGGYTFGTSSPAPTYHSGMYTPGMLMDAVKEVKDAARIREDALLSRVKAMVEERFWSINDINLKIIHDIDEIKLQINQLKKEQSENNSRFIRIEEDNQSLRLLISHLIKSNESKMHLAQNFEMNSDYGRKSNYYNHNTKHNRQHQQQQQQQHHLFQQQQQQQQHTDESFNNISSIENEMIRPQNHNFAEKQNYAQANEHLVEKEKETLELRRELQEALANQKNAEKKAQALEDIKNISTGNLNETIQSSGNNRSAISSRNSSISESNSILSQGKLASQIQTISSISLSGPVTDL